MILVDELDRCRPDYAISYLETINHIFDIYGIIFVLAVDRKQLECSAKAAFGNDLNFPEYYRKFVQREVMFPKPSIKIYHTLASEYVGYYMQKENERYCFLSVDPSRLEDIVNLISSMEMTPRQVQEVFRIMGHVLETDKSSQGQIRWCIGVGTILMASLKICNADIYEALGTQHLGIKQAATFFRKLVLKDADWWFTICLTGGGLNPEEVNKKNPADIYTEAGFISNQDEAQIIHDIEQFRIGWGYSTKNRFYQIHSNIEQVSSWK